MLEINNVPAIDLI